MNLKSIICPVSINKIDKNTARIGSILTSALLGIYIYTGNIVFIGIILLDFILRVFFENLESPSGFVAKRINALFSSRKNIINKGPKIFAWRTGFLFALTSFVVYFFSPTTSIIVAEILLVFALLDGLANLCIGCVVYTYIILPLMNPQTDAAN